MQTARDLLDALTDHADLAGFTPGGDAILHLTLPVGLFDSLCAYSALDESGTVRQGAPNATEPGTVAGDDRPS